MGLFNFGRKTELLQWQKFVLTDSPDRLIMTEKQLRDETIRRAKRNLEIANDCSKIIQTTTKPTVFFSRLSLFKEKLIDLNECEKYIDFAGASPSAALAEVINKEQECVFQFLKRYLIETLDKADAAKTSAGKLGKFKKFHESLQPYYPQISRDNIEYIETRYQAYSRKYIK